MMVGHVLDLYTYISEDHKQNKYGKSLFHYLKLVSAIFYQFFIFSSNDKSSKTMKNVFYFI